MQSRWDCVLLANGSAVFPLEQISSLEICLLSKTVDCEFPENRDHLSVITIPPVPSPGTSRCLWIELTGLTQDVLPSISRALFTTHTPHQRSCQPTLCLHSRNCLISCHLTILWLEELCHYVYMVAHGFYCCECSRKLTLACVTCLSPVDMLTPGQVSGPPASLGLNVVSFYPVSAQFIRVSITHLVNGPIAVCL